MSENNGTGPPKDFTTQFIDFYKDFESPTSFWRWGAYATIAATLRNNVYFEYGAGRIYPNIYVVFLADSAEYRKGAPIIASRGLLRELKVTKLFSGTASIQGILDELSTDIADRNTGQPIRGGSCLITADEFAAFFVQDTRLIPLLTDLWEYREEYDYKLRGGSIKIKDTCASILAASNETFLREVYDSRAVYGGLLGRTYMIKPDETRPPNSLMYTEIAKYDKKPLIQALQQIRKLSGPIKITPDGAKTYDDWYNDLYKKYKKHPDRTGVLQRMHTNVIKLAIILTAATYKLEVTPDIFKEAIVQVTSLKQNYDIYVMSAGKSDLAMIGGKFLSSMWENEKRQVNRRDFLMLNWSEVSVDDFDKLVETMRQGGMIDIVLVGQDIYYKMTPKCIEKMAKNMEKT